MKLLLILITTIVHARQLDDWWYNQGDDWGTSDYFSAINPFYQTYKQVKNQMDMYGYAKHVGKINRGQFLNPELNQPSNRAFGYQSDFNPKDIHSGAFRYRPKGQKYRAKAVHVNAGLASHVGEIRTMPVGQHVQSDGTVLVQADGKQDDPCDPNPCNNNVPRCEVVNDGTVKCSRTETFTLTLTWEDPDEDVFENDLDLGIVASLHDGSSCTTDAGVVVELIDHRTASAVCGVEMGENGEGQDFGYREMETAYFDTYEGSSWHDYTYAILAQLYDYNLSEGSPMLIVADDNGDSVQVLAVPQFDHVSNVNNAWREMYFFGCFRSPLGEVDTTGAGFYDLTDEVKDTGLTVTHPGLCKALLKSKHTPGFTPYNQLLPFRDETFGSCSGQPGQSVKCCTADKPCRYLQGPCKVDDSLCSAGLVCGHNNCKDWHSGATEHGDCCVTPEQKRAGCKGESGQRGCCLPGTPCSRGGGNCQLDSGCRGDLVCGVNNCQDFHDTAQPWTDCCVRPDEKESDAKHQITRCETSSLQKPFNCEKAYNGDTTTETTKGYINGWAYRGKIPSWVVFYLDTSVTTNTIIFKTALKRADHHLNDFSIEVRVGTKFEAVAIKRVNIANANIKGNRVKTNNEDNIRVAFQPKKGVTAIKLTAFGSDASNENSVINDIHVLFLADINMDWAENDVDGILNKIA